MNKKIICLICALQSPLVIADIGEQENKPTGAIGANVGWVEANGLSYRKYFSDQYIQFSFAGAYDKTKKQEYFDASISHAKYLTVIDNPNFLPLALKVVSGIEVERDVDRSGDLVDDSKQGSPNELHLGAGFGMDIFKPRRKGLGASAAATYTASFKDFKQLEFVKLGLLPSASLYYNY